MGKNKKRNRWSNQPRKQQIVPESTYTTLSAPRVCKNYWATALTDEERQIYNSPIAVAQHAGVFQRLSLLITTFYKVHSVQSLLFGEMQSIVENWGVMIKGIQPTINSLQNSEDKFIDVMHDLIKHYGKSDYSTKVYAQDVDALFTRIMIWMGISKEWKPGLQEEEENMMENEIANSLKDGTLRLKGCNTMEPEPKSEARILYTIAEMNADGDTGTIIKQDITKKGLATIQANKLAKKNTGKMYIIYEQRMQVLDTCHMTPFKAVQMPAGDNAELVEIDIIPSGTMRAVDK